jgi:tRNA G37 N-methylase Trm5
MANIRSAAGERGIEVLRLGEVKYFAPAISHYVIDFRAL